MAMKIHVPTGGTAMPARPVTALIVVFWLATMGWFGYRELWPLLFPDDAPPFVIELADEVTSEFASQTRGPDVLWGVYHGDKRIGRAETRLRYFRQDNTFEMESRLVDIKLDVPMLAFSIPIHVPEMINAYRLTRSGELRAIRTEGRLSIDHFVGQAVFFGEVRNGKLYRRGSVDLGLGKKTDVTLDPLDAPTGSVLNPMHPVSKIKGLRPGRRWVMPIINPMSDAVEPTINALLTNENLVGKAGFKPIKLKLPEGPKFVNAEVLDETTMIKLNDKDHACRIIEYRGDGQPARTYVRISDGAVMKQEATAFGKQITLRRE
jgi:hypothetical protein